jgi:hypothetical protein
MMTFGWRPPTSCYKQAANELRQAQQAQQPPCPSAMWWYVLMGLAVVAGSMKK